MSLRRCKARGSCQRLAPQGRSTTGDPHDVASASLAQVCTAFCNVGFNAGRYPVNDLRRSHKWLSASHDCGSIDGLWAFVAGAFKLKLAQNLMRRVRRSFQSPIATVCSGGLVQPGLSAAVQRLFFNRHRSGDRNSAMHRDKNIVGHNNRTRTPLTVPD